MIGVIGAEQAVAFDVRVHDSVREIAQDAWDACFTDEAESWAYYAATEAALLPGFTWCYFAVRERGQVIAVAPAFITEYRLDTTIQGRVKQLLRPLLAVLRPALTLRLLCLGSPVADICHLGFSATLTFTARGEVAACLLRAFETYATSRGIGLLAAKDMVDDVLAGPVGAAFVAAGYARQPSLPNAVLDVRYSDLNGYLAALSTATRRDIRRKLRVRHEVQVERRYGRQALELVPEILRLYDAQRARSNVDFEQFETLTPEYFRQVLLEHEGALVFVYRDRGGDQRSIAGFNFCYHSARVFVDKFIGLDQPRAGELNLYVLSWINNVEYCIEQRIATLQSGQTGYSMKRRLGSRLVPSSLLFRHRNRGLNVVLRAAGPLLAANRYDKIEPVARNDGGRR